MSLTSKTILVMLKIEMLGIEERDRPLSEDVNQNYLGVNAGFYYKCKIDKRYFRDVRAAAHTARIYHRSVTVPWDGHWRLLLASKALEYGNKMSTFKIAFENAVNDLKLQWPAILTSEQTRLGNHFDMADYPDQSVLEKYFSFSHDFNPVADQSHLILDVENSVVEELKTSLNKANDFRIQEAKRDMYTRLLGPISRMANICSNDKRVYDSMVNDVVGVTSLLTELSSCMEDQVLLAKLTEVKTKLVGYTPGQIREDRELKEKLGADAATIAKELSDHISGKTI